MVWHRREQAPLINCSHSTLFSKRQRYSSFLKESATEKSFSAFHPAVLSVLKRTNSPLSSAAQTPWQVNYTQLLTCIFLTCVTGCVRVQVRCGSVINFYAGKFILFFSSMHKHTLQCFAAISVHMLFYASVCAWSFSSFNALVICLCSRGPLVLIVAQTEARQAGRQAEVGDFSGSCMDSAAGWVIVTVAITQTPLCTLLFPTLNSSLTLCTGAVF